MVWSRTAVNAFTPTLTRPKLIEPDQTARAIPPGYPLRALSMRVRRASRGAPGW